MNVFIDGSQLNTDYSIAMCTQEWYSDLMFLSQQEHSDLCNMLDGCVFE